MKVKFSCGCYVKIVQPIWERIQKDAQTMTGFPTRLWERGGQNKQKYHDVHRQGAKATTKNPFRCANRFTPRLVNH